MLFFIHPATIIQYIRATSKVTETWYILDQALKLKILLISIIALNFPKKIIVDFITHKHYDVILKKPKFLFT